MDFEPFRWAVEKANYQPPLLNQDGTRINLKTAFGSWIQKPYSFDGVQLPERQGVGERGTHQATWGTGYGRRLHRKNGGARVAESKRNIYIVLHFQDGGLRTTCPIEWGYS
jgi:hypothetical protein